MNESKPNIAIQNEAQGRMVNTVEYFSRKVLDSMEEELAETYRQSKVVGDWWFPGWENAR